MYKTQKSGKGNVQENWGKWGKPKCPREIFRAKSQAEKLVGRKAKESHEICFQGTSASFKKTEVTSYFWCEG